MAVKAQIVSLPELTGQAFVCGSILQTDFQLQRRQGWRRTPPVWHETPDGGGKGGAL